MQHKNKTDNKMLKKRELVKFRVNFLITESRIFLSLLKLGRSEVRLEPKRSLIKISTDFCLVIQNIYKVKFFF